MARSEDQFPPRSHDSEWPPSDREIVLRKLKESEDRIMTRLNTLETRLQALQSSELMQESRLKHLEEVGRVAGRHAGLAWGTAGSGIIAFLIWFLQQLAAGNVPGVGPGQ